MLRRLSHFITSVLRQTNQDQEDSHAAVTADNTRENNHNNSKSNSAPKQEKPEKPTTTIIEKVPRNESETEPSSAPETAGSLRKDDTLVRKPSTFEIHEQLKVKRTSRWGELLPANRAILMLTFPDTKNPPIRIEVKDRLVIGRRQQRKGPAPDVNLNRYGGYLRGVSRQHIALIKQPDLVQVMDLGSTNGTYLNGVRLKPNQPRILRDGDQLHLGQLLMWVYFVSPEETTDLALGNNDQSAGFSASDDE